MPNYEVPVLALALPLSARSPVEIDGELVRLNGIADRALAVIEAAAQSIAFYAKPNLPETVRSHYVAKAEENAASARAFLSALSLVRAPLQAEYEARRWTRFEFVPGGHVHSMSPRCSTLHPTTARAFLFDRSGSSVDAVIEHFGIVACTVCFPSAPTFASYQEGLKEAAALEAAKSALICPGSGTRPSAAGAGGYRSRWLRCPDCSRTVAATPRGLLRSHAKVSAAVARALAKAAAKAAGPAAP